MLPPYEALRAFLLGRPEITAIVGSRIFYAQIPQGSSVPLLLITHVSGRRSHDLGMAGVDVQRLSIECRSTTVADASGANVLGGMVIDALDAARLPSVQLVSLAGDVTLYEDSSKSIRRIIDFHCHLGSG